MTKLKTKPDLSDVREFGIIVVVPEVYIQEYRYQNVPRLGYMTNEEMALKIVADYSGIDMSNYRPLNFSFKEDFDRNCLLVRISSNEKIDGLYEISPGNCYVYLNIARSICDGT